MKAVLVSPRHLGPSYSSRTYGRLQLRITILVEAIEKNHECFRLLVVPVFVGRLPLRRHG